MKFSIKDFFSNCDQTRSLTADMVIFTEETLSGTLNFLCRDIMKRIFENINGKLYQ